MEPTVPGAFRVPGIGDAYRDLPHLATVRKIHKTHDAMSGHSRAAGGGSQRARRFWREAPQTIACRACSPVPSVSVLADSEG